MTKNRTNNILTILLSFCCIFLSIITPIIIIMIHFDNLNYYQEAFILNDVNILFEGHFSTTINETDQYYTISKIIDSSSEIINVTFIIDSFNCQLKNYSFNLLLPRDNYYRIIFHYDFELQYLNNSYTSMFKDFISYQKDLYYVSSKKSLTMISPIFTILFISKR